LFDAVSGCWDLVLWGVSKILFEGAVKIWATWAWGPAFQSHAQGYHQDWEQQEQSHGGWRGTLIYESVGPNRLIYFIKEN
jgi:hypothetical protein